MNEIHVMIANNDNRGNITNGAFMMDFSFPDGTKNPETFLRVESRFGDENGPVPIKCICDPDNDRIIELHGVRIKHGGVRTWVGNMCWNLYPVRYDYCLGLINVMMASSEWSCTEAWTEIFEKWEKGDTITAKDLDIDEHYQPVVLNVSQRELPFKNPC